MDKTLEKDLVERVLKLERDVAVLKKIQKATDEKNAADDEWYIRTWDHKVR